jgi:sn1-specific diacylglycerol lipase
LADHSTKSVVLSIRGSWSVSDIFTDLSGAPAKFSAPGMPEDTYAHYGMTVCVDKLMARLNEDNLLDQAMTLYNDYDLVITGHSLGAGLSILVGAKLRESYPNLKVYAFSTPNGTLSRNAIKVTEQFAFSIAVGDDFIPRLSIEAIEQLRNGILETLQSCKLSKVSKEASYTSSLCLLQLKNLNFFYYSFIQML